MMSLCHILLAVDLKKNRGLAGFFLTSGLGLTASPSLARVRYTLLALAGTRKHRIRMSAIRRAPKPGCFRLIKTILPRTSAGIWLERAMVGLLRRPCSPCSRYAFDQRYTKYSLMPNSWASRVASYPSSRCNRTTRSRKSKG
jgi:hypothetical protein